MSRANFNPTIKGTTSASYRSPPDHVSRRLQPSRSAERDAVAPWRARRPGAWRKPRVVKDSWSILTGDIASGILLYATALSLRRRGSIMTNNAGLSYQAPSPATSRPEQR